MTSEGQPAAIVRSPWTTTLQTLLSVVNRDLLIVCPYVTRPATRLVIEQFERRRVAESMHIGLVTDLNPDSVLAGSMDLDALIELGSNLRNFELTHLPSVHAKVYVADCKLAIVTSGNLTNPGLSGNIEYGVALAQEPIVREVRSDFESYASLGAKVSLSDIAALSSEMEETKALFQRAQRSVRGRARRAFEQRLQSTRLRLLRHRAKGKTTHSIFSDTLRFLLERGPLRTEELHPLVKLLHPDLCDDSVERVIDGVHFGKKWKHHVRSAQQFLKRHGEIRFDGTRWRLVADP